MLLETVMSRGNMNAAYKRVMSNKGSGGVDNMGLDELLPYLKSHGEELTASILNGRYKPNPVCFMSAADILPAIPMSGYIQERRSL